jgi:hypothetical protein
MMTTVESNRASDESVQLERRSPRAGSGVFRDFLERADEARNVLTARRSA